MTGCGLMSAKYKTNWDELTSVEKGRLLELVFLMLCLFLKNKLGCSYSDRTYADHKKDKGKHVIDFELNTILVELKNWYCYTENGYTIEKRDVDNQILPKFEGYPKHMLKLLVIAKPKWGKGVKKYLASKGVIIIELGFQVRNNSYDMMKAYWLLRKEIARKLGLLDKDTSRCRLDKSENYDTFDEEIHVLGLLIDELCIEPG